MAETRLKCPSCGAVLKLAAPLAPGKAIKCPKCAAVIRPPADGGKTGGPTGASVRPGRRPQPAQKGRPEETPDEDAEDNDEERPRLKKGVRRPVGDEEEQPRKRKKKRDEEGQRKKFLWLGIGGGLVVAAAVVLIVVLVSGKPAADRGKDNTPPGQGADSARPSGPGSPEAGSPKGLDVGAPLTAMAMAPDGRTLVVSGYGETKNVRVWDLQTRQVLRTFDSPCQSTSALALALSPDGKLLASPAKVPSSGDVVVEVRELSGGQSPRRLDWDSSSSIHGLAFAPDGNLVVASSGIKICGWDPRTGRKVFAWEKAGIRPTDVCFFPDGKRLVAGGNVADKLVRVWDVTTGTPTQTLTPPRPDEALKVVVSPDGRYVAASIKQLNSTYIAVWDAGTGSIVRELPVQAAWVNTLLFLRDGKTLAYPHSAPFTGGNMSDSADIALVDVTTGARVRTLKGHHKEVQALLLTPDGKTLISGDGGGAVKFWDLGRK